MKKYTEDGVDTVEGDSLSACAGKLCASTYGNSPLIEVYDMSQGNFRGPRGYRLVQVPPDCVMTLAPDGVGTKVVVIDASFGHRKAGFDLAAMTGMDITRWGGKPLVFTNVLDTFTIGKQGDRTNVASRELLAGLVDAAKVLQMVVLNGETAELSSCVGSENPDATVMFNWAGVAWGIYHPKKMILGDTLAPGQSIMALKDWFRSNGHSSARKALAMHFGPKWWENPDATETIAAVATPSMLYDPFLNHVHGWDNPDLCPIIPIHLIVHNSGGAIEDKFAKDLLFPAGLSAELDDLFDPPQAMKDIVTWRGMTDLDWLGTFNGGQGALVVVDPENEGQFIDLAESYGVTARRCGRIIETAASEMPQVCVLSKFTGEWVTLKSKPKQATTDGGLR
ncbi:MAG: AIR synthase related protein [Patescibacteria group bacterium]|jgi:phosphoribosylaminoimidazole (AIR) synthetase